MKKRIELRVGDQTLRVLKIAQAKAGDVYLAPPTPTGLHISHHASGKKHVRDNEGLHRQILDPTPGDALHFAHQFAYAPADEAVLVVIQQPALAGPAPAPDDSPVIVVDFVDLMRRLENVEMTAMRGRDLKAFALQHAGIDLIIMDLTALQLAFVRWQEGHLLALAFGEDFEETMRQIAATPLGEKTIEPIAGSLREVSERVDAGELAHPWEKVDMDQMNRDLEPLLLAFVERVRTLTSGPEGLNGSETARRFP